MRRGGDVGFSDSDLLIPAVVVTLYILSPQKNHFAHDGFVELSARAGQPLDLPEAKPV